MNNDIDSEYSYDYGVKFDGSKEQMEEYGFDESYDYEIGDIIDDAGIDSKYCPICNGLKVHDDELLEFAIRRLNTNKDELIEAYKRSKGK